MNDQTGVAGRRRRTRAEVERVVAEFAGSGLNRAEFCRRQAMSLGTLNRYLKRVHAQADSGAKLRELPASNGLVAVELASPKLAAGSDGCYHFAVVLPNGRKIEVRTGFDGPTLERLVQLLETM